MRPYRQLSTSLARTAGSLMSIVDVLGRGEQGPRMPDKGALTPLDPARMLRFAEIAMSIWTICAGIVQTLIVNPSKRGAFLAIFTRTRQLVLSRPVELCEVQTYLATDLAKSRVSSRVAVY